MKDSGDVQVLRLVLLSAALAACHDSNAAGQKRDATVDHEASVPLVFDVHFRDIYTQVRPCRFPGEHTGLNGFTVWVNDVGRDSFASIWQTPPAVSAVADGTVVVKELYTSQDCGAATIGHWVAMRKEAGFDPDHGDWHWQEVASQGKVLSDGRVDSCIQCHSGNDSSCAGYGLAAGRDYLCTAP